MPEVPMTLEELLLREDEAWATLANTFNAVPADRREIEGVVPGWSAHDLVWHCAYWVAWASDVLERLHRGEPEPKQPEDEDAWDAEVLGEGRSMSWDAAFGRLEENRARVREALSAFSEAPELAVQWFTDDTFDHYDEHGAQVRAFIG
jgi:hypothetical protein